MTEGKYRHHSGSRGGWSLMGRFLMWSMRNKSAG